MKIDKRQLNKHDAIRSRKPLAIEAAEYGFYTYQAGAVSSTLLADSLSMRLSTPQQAIAVVAAIVDGKKYTDTEIDEVVRRVFFRLGVFRAYQERKGGGNGQEG